MEEALAVDGLKICYDVEGAGDKLLLIHGLGAGRKVWRHLLPAASRYFRTYAVDLPGFGCSDKPDVAYGIPYYAEFVRQFMDAAGIEKAAVAGASMGGAVVAAFAAKYPERVARLILIAPAGFTPLRSLPVKSESLADASLWLMSYSRSLLVKMFEDSFYDRASIPQDLVDEFWTQMKDRNYRRAFIRNSTYLSQDHPEFAGILGNIRAPTLLLWGADDAVIPASDAEQFAGLIPRSEVKVLDRCGHMPAVEKGDACADAMLSFLGEVDLYYTNDEL
jgi:pimeloyl-ACP methyl ester carboxylesterase